MYSIKGLKTFRSHDGGGFEVTLYKNGKRTAVVSNGGHGGPDEWLPIRKGQNINDDFKEMKAWCIDNCEPIEFHGTTLTMTPDLYMDELINEATLKKDLKKWLKKIVMVEDGQILTINQPYNEGWGEELARRHPNAVMLNTLPFDEALVLVKGAA